MHHALMMSALIAAAIAACAPAIAQEAGPEASPEAGMVWLDKDRDGQVSLNEYLFFQTSRIARFDMNGNGKLSRDEFKESLNGKARQTYERSFRAFDRDKSKGLDQREFLGYHAFVFNTYIDTNKDGQMSLEELAALAEPQG
ncbi:MAG: EF-hand domain-containing protein [Hyphomonadaceae bacterium]